MDKEFLHKINLDALQKEVNKSIYDIGILAELKNPKGVYKWAKGSEENGTRPSYNTLVRLLQNGASVETLFGVDYKSKNNAERKTINITDDDIARAFIRVGEMLKNNELKNEKV